MKKLKKIDFWISVFVFFFCLIVIILEADYDKLSILFACLVMGTWHIVSMAIHFFGIKNWRYPTIRYCYSTLSLAVVVYYFAINLNDMDYYLLLPIMALFYTAFCGFEIYYNKQHAEI